MRAISAITTLVVNIFASALIFVFLLLAMNGFHENDAQFGLIAYILMAFAISLIASAAAFFLAGRLLKRGYRQIAASAISVAAFSAAGSGLFLLSALAAVLIAEAVRVNF